MKLSKKVLDYGTFTYKKICSICRCRKSSRQKRFTDLISDSLISRLRRHSSTQLRIMTKKFWLMLIHREFPLFWMP